MRGKGLLYVAALVAMVGMSVGATDARACGAWPGPTDAMSRSYHGGTLPANGWIVQPFAELPLVEEAGRVVPLREVARYTLMDMGGRTEDVVFHRPAGGFTLGSRVRVSSCGEARCEVFIVGEDRTAPTKPLLSEVDVRAEPERRQEHPCGFTPRLGVVVQGQDDAVAERGVAIVTYLATTDTGAQSTSSVHDMRWIGYPQGALGAADQFVESVSLYGLPLDEDFCVAMALMDHAGNVGPRSDSLCVSPRVGVTTGQTVALEEPSCAVGAGGASSPVVVLLWLVGVFGRRRRSSSR